MIVLAGDIGGTHSRLALFEVEGARFEEIEEETYRSAEYASLREIVRRFVASRRAPCEHAPCERACFGIAGPVLGDTVKATNLPWQVEGRLLAEELGIGRVSLVNDLEANAHGIARLRDDELVVLQEGSPRARGNRAILAAGTGLGEAGIYWDGTRHRPFATEGGHCAFSPVGDLQIALLRYLAARFGHVSWERVVSGPGLVHIHEFLLQHRRSEKPDWLARQMEEGDPAAAISKAALEGRCPVCVEALELFVQLYGAEAGNLALKVMATGGVFVGGGIAPKILDKLKESDFVRAFCAKGRLASVMEQIPVRVILNDRTALLGAATCAVEEG